mmetsp:Transcript_39096/g.60910  ORF Transcript_39096/g.60910 Transcript_39096/m.60910 type:complete len:106 (+) Transcript_39096:765-1082(+)
MNLLKKTRKALMFPCTALSESHKVYHRRKRLQNLDLSRYNLRVCARLVISEGTLNLSQTQRHLRPDYRSMIPAETVEMRVKLGLNRQDLWQGFPKQRNFAGGPLV